MHWQDITFLLVGVFLIIISFLKNKALSNKPVELSLEKPFAISFKADRFTLVFLMGVIVSMVGVFFRLKGYEGTIRANESTITLNEKRIATLEKDVLKIENEIKETIREELEKSKFRDLKLNLVFTEGINPENFKIEVQSKKSTDDEFVQIGNINPERGQESNLLVKLSYLSKGEIIRIRAIAPDNTIWTCEDLIIPKNTIQMKLKK